MKNNKILDSLYYTFTPSIRKIKFADQLGLKHEDILLIINLSKNNLMIFNFGSTQTGGVFSNGILTLVFNTTTMLADDKLMIIVRDEEKTDIYLKEINNTLKNIEELIFNLNKN